MLEDLKLKCIWSETIRFVTIFAAYFFSLRFVFPGYFNPLIPHHSDLFDYVNDGSTVNIFNVFKSARPTGDFLLGFFSGADFRVPIAFAIVVTLLNIYLLFKIAEKILQTKLHNGILLLFSVLIFTFPGFYINYTYDIYSTFALFFFILLIFQRVTDSCNGEFRIARYMLLAFLSMTAKETYMLSIIVFMGVQIFFEYKDNRKKVLIAFSLMSGLLILLLVRSKLSGSSFTSFSVNTTDPYYVNTNITSVINTYLFYIKGAIGTIYNAIALIVVLCLSIKNKRKLLWNLTFVIAGLSAYLPYSVLPNHIVPHYFGIGIMLIYMPLLILDFRIGEFKFNRWISHCVLLILIAGNLFLPMGYGSLYNSIQWAIQPEAVNSNVLKDIDTVINTMKPSERVLVTGFYANEESPYKAGTFISSLTSKETDISIATVRGSQNNIENKLININEIKLSNYDKVIVYNLNGKLKDILSKDEISRKDRSSILFPEIENEKSKVLSDPQNWYTHFNLGLLYFGYNLNEDAEKEFLLSNTLCKEENPYPNYYLGKIMELKNNKVMALTYYQRSLEKDKTNPNFIAAIRNLK